MKADRILQAGPEGIAAAAECIRSGGVVVYPTETVYGIAVDPANPAAVDRAYGLKGRDARKGLILLVRGMADVDHLVSRVSDDAHSLIRAFWPGPLTLVFRAGDGLPPSLPAPDRTVALRASGSPLCASLVAAVAGPVTSTSANRSGHPPALSANEALNAFGDEVDLILDGGPASNPVPSTLVDLTVSPPSVLREGPISAEAVARILGHPVTSA